MPHCPTCEQVLDTGMEFCPADGTRLVEDTPEGDGGDPLVGTLLQGRYRMEECIGQGGMGVVYRAVQVNIDRDVAVKLLTIEAGKREDTVRRFANEAKVISRLRSPNTLKLIDFGKTDDGRLFCVMEFLAGAPLDAVLESGSIGPARTLDVLVQVCDSLAEAHAEGIVHRDLKPANLFVERVGAKEVVKVLDFGIARVNSQTSHTATGMVFGTPAYMSPEQAQGKKVDHRSDLYSVGVIAWECLVGRPPFEAETPVSLLLKHVTDVPDRISALSPPVTIVPELDDLVARLLAKEPDDRPQSAEELQQEVISIYQALPADLKPERSGMFRSAAAAGITGQTAAITGSMTLDAGGIRSSPSSPISPAVGVMAAAASTPPPSHAPASTPTPSSPSLQAPAPGSGGFDEIGDDSGGSRTRIWVVATAAALLLAVGGIAAALSGGGGAKPAAAGDGSNEDGAPSAETGTGPAAPTVAAPNAPASPAPAPAVPAKAKPVPSKAEAAPARGKRSKRKPKAKRTRKRRAKAKEVAAKTPAPAKKAAAKPVEMPPGMVPLGLGD